MSNYLEKSNFDNIQDTKPVKLYCSCCLSESERLIDTSKCYHYKSYEILFKNNSAQNTNYGALVCGMCHAMLVKIDKFNNMVKRTELILLNQLTNVNTQPFIQFEISKQNKEITMHHEEVVHVKVELFEENEISVDMDPNYLLYCANNEEKVNEDSAHSSKTAEVTSTDRLKSQQVSEEWEGKIQFINLTNEQLEREKIELASQESFTSIEYKCHDCLVGFNYEFKLKSHIEQKHVQKHDTALCHLCKCYVTVRSLRKHMLTHYGRWRCCLCNVMFKSKNAIISHYNEAHEKIEGSDFKCDQCEYAARSYRTLLYHKRKHKLPDTLSYQCAECSKSFLNKESYKNHMEAFHLTTNQFKCSICEKQFRLKQSLRLHCKQVHEAGNSIYICEICKSSFKKRSTFRNHMAGHYNEYECDYCGMKFNRKYTLKDHILSKHLRSSTLMCVPCDKVFCSKKTLKTHITTVHQETERPKSKICKHCGKSFAKISTLMGHLNSHTGAKPYSCKYCSSKFGYKSAVYTHTRIVHFGGKTKREVASAAKLNIQNV